MTSAGSFVFFRAKAKGYGTELWRSDGTAAGTMLVEDVNTISNSSWPSNLTDVAGTLYFTAFDNTYRQRLWRSDGTAAGTRFVGEIGAVSPLFSSSRVSRYAPRKHPPPPPPIAALAAIEPTLFISAWAPDVGYELWKSNGTAPGTVLVKDIVPGPQSSYPHSVVDLRGAALFVADDAEVWRSDGTEAGTAPVIQFEHTDARLSDLLVSTDGAFFTRAEPTGTTLWQTDGTAAGTHPVKRVGDGDAALSGVWRVGHTTVFATVNRSTAMLWRTDGSERSAVGQLNCCAMGVGGQTRLSCVTSAPGTTPVLQTPSSGSVTCCSSSPTTRGSGESFTGGVRNLIAVKIQAGATA